MKGSPSDAGHWEPDLQYRCLRPKRNYEMVAVTGGSI